MSHSMLDATQPQDRSFPHDPKAYTRPWSGSFTVPWTYTNWDGTEGGEIHEYFCQENERDHVNLR